MQLRLYFDEDAMSRSVVRGLRARGIDVKTVLDTATKELGDEEQLELATADKRALCTSNVGDFYRIHTSFLKEGREHAGIVMIPQQRYGVGEQIRRISRLVLARSLESMRNQVEFLSAW